MRIAVVGLWHLGSVTSACLAQLGHEVTGLDDKADVIARLNLGQAPLFEPGLDALIAQGLAARNLHFTTDAHAALQQAELVWITYDTPVDDDDHADIDSVIAAVGQKLPLLNDGTVVLVSSQLPAGSVGRLQDFARRALAGKTIHFAVSPENLRLGKAIDVFLNPDRIIIGTHDDQARIPIERMLAPLKARVEWMSIESAEVTKHAINAFLALSVAFANELASLCELVGADAKEVERGLTSEARIGPKAYLSPGGPFAGGTLARDLVYLEGMGQAHHLALPLISAVRPSNDAHKLWVRRILLQHSPSLADIPVAIWGLTYKPGTDTLRRSLAVELCDWLIGQGAEIHIHDPAVTQWPQHWQDRVTVHADPLAAARAARYLVIGTEWKEFGEHLDALGRMAQSGLILIDPNRHLQAVAEAFGQAYIAVGVPSSISNRGRA